MDINVIDLYGKVILQEPTYTIHDKSYTKYYVAVHRKSGKADALPVIVGGHLLKNCTVAPGDFVKITGCLRSRNYYESGKRALQGFVHALAISAITEDEYNEATDRNIVHMQGYVCMPVTERLTKRKGRNIADIMLATARQNCQTNYISCVVWGDQALEAADYQIGDKLDIKGRYQSRSYIRKVGENIVERVIYELHVYEVTKIQEAAADITA